MIALRPPVPVLRSFSESKAREFYCGFLGCTVQWEHRFEPDLPLVMQVSRDGLVLILSEHHGDGAPGALLRIPTTGLTALRDELLARQYGNARPGLQEQPWGAIEMTVHDPFGNRLVFAEPVPG